ncbi:MAG: IS3 family transposase [Acidithiobacillus sp.]|nr:IS3 family transposase [Acidithiobacillus sp.]
MRQGLSRHSPATGIDRLPVEEGNGYDNAPIESFWGSLKNERVHQQHFETRSEACAAIREYIEIFYNRQRRHSRIGYLALAVFAQTFTRVAA